MVDIQLEKGVSESVVERELDESEGSDFSDFSSEDNDEWDEDKDTDHTLSRENSENKKGGSIFSLQRQQSTMSNFDRGSSQEVIRKINAFELMNLTTFDCAHMFDDYANVANSTTRFISSATLQKSKSYFSTAKKLGCEVKANPGKPYSLTTQSFRGPNRRRKI